MDKRVNKPITCVVSGKPIDKICSIYHTEVGPISAPCLSVYNRAVDELSMRLDLSPAGLRKLILSKIQDSEYARETIFLECRDRVLDILAGDESTERDSAGIVRKLKEIFLQGVDVDQYADCDKGGQGLELRRALGCMNEDIRTIKFCDALLTAVEKQEKQKEHIEMVDAGTGPVPLFGILAALKSCKVSVTCLEINPHSAKMAEEVIRNLGLEDRVKVVRVDATNYTHDKEIDLLISETMFAGLTNGEEMIQILCNLAPQVEEGGETIPKSITVEAGITEFGIGPVEQLRIPLRQVYKYSIGEEPERIDFSLPLEGLMPYQSYELVLASNVCLNDDVTVWGNDSDISKPTRIGMVGLVLDEKNLSQSLHVSYEPGSQELEIEMEIC